MSRWIDADAFLKEYCEPYPHIYKAMSRAMADAPSIDIVRCKDCRNLYIDTSDEGTSCYWCGVWANATDEDSFCSHGKRKDEPQTDSFPCNNCKNHDECCTKEFECKYEPQTDCSACDTCQWYNSGIPCGVEPSVCKREVKDEPQTGRSNNELVE